MRRYIYILLLCVAGLSFSSCVIDINKDETISSNPRFRFSVLFWHEEMLPVFKVGKLAAFFAEYQEIRSDREAAEALWQSYFPEQYINLYYEEARVYSLGTIRLVAENEFYVEPSYMYGNSFSSYSVTFNPLEKSLMIISSEGDETFMCELFVEGDSLVLKESEYLGADSAGTDIQMNVLEQISVPYKEDLYTYYPVAGGVSFRLKGEVNDEFEVRYSMDSWLVGGEKMELQN